jgi:hypothetical protein
MTTNPTTFTPRIVPFAGFVIFTPWVSSYTGSKKLKPEDIGLTDKDLPPADLATLGAMHTCDPKSLQPFESARNAQANACLEFGTRAFGGFAVPRNRAIEVAKKLDEIKLQFYAYKDTFLRKFVVAREDWITAPAFAKWTDKIRDRLHSVEYLDRQIQCAWECYTLAPTTDLPVGDGVDLGLGTIAAATAVGDSALTEVATICKAVIRESFLDDKGLPKNEVTQKILRPLRRARDKLDGLSFADPRLIGVVKYFDSVTGSLPLEGKMSGAVLNSLFSLVSSMSDPELILAASFACRQTIELDGSGAGVMAVAHEQQQQLKLDTSPVPDDEMVATPEVLSTTTTTAQAPSADDPAESDVVYDCL